MRLLLKLAFFLLSSYVGIALNDILVGEVRSLEEKKPLAYVNIGINQKTIGTVSNASGKFMLQLNEKVALTDTVIFSFIGYYSKKFTISQLQNNNEAIYLQSAPAELSALVVTSKKVTLKSKKIGRHTKGLGLTHANFYTYYEKDVDDRLSKEMGMKFELKRNCLVKDLNFFISGNDFAALKFRVNFYSIKNGLPTDLIIHQNIIFDIKDNYKGWFKVDLTPFEIYLKEEQVAVTIQWLESVKKDNKSKYFAISAVSSPFNTTFFREKPMDKWTPNKQSLSFYLNAMCE
jgi:hypothetical protein